MSVPSSTTLQMTGARAGGNRSKGAAAHRLLLFWTSSLLRPNLGAPPGFVEFVSFILVGRVKHWPVLLPSLFSPGVFRAGLLNTRGMRAHHRAGRYRGAGGSEWVELLVWSICSRPLHRVLGSGCRGHLHGAVCWW